ncbi:hypothetical protein K440DRAFT_662300 [Wilcoxina mikolae CBS 423.85]|nr:hypothetical protein K440DRAFT_662300 [Wilcoxina mikolae CBS 423.85]
MMRFPLGVTYEDEAVFNFLRDLMIWATTGTNALLSYITRHPTDNVMDQIVENLGLRYQSPHYRVIRKYWGSFSAEIYNCNSIQDFRNLVRRYIICSLWYAYTEEREDVNPGDDWDLTRDILLRTTVEIVESRFKEKWERMKDIRDRFLVRRKYIADILEYDTTVSERMRRVFDCGKKAWKYALRAIAKDIQHGYMPRGGEGAAVLVVAWSINSRSNTDVYSVETSPEFDEALEQWIESGDSEIRDFIDKCWPFRTRYHQDSPRNPREPDEFPELLRNILSPMSSAIDSDTEFQVTRKILSDCLDDDDLDDSISEISLEAATVAATLDDSISSKPSSTQNVVRPPDIVIQQFAMEPGISTGICWLGGAILIGIIVARFLFGLTPLLLLRLLPLDNSSCLADTLQSYASACLVVGEDSSFSFLEGKPFRVILDRVRHGIVRSIEEVELILLQTVPVDTIESVLIFCAACVSHLHKLGIIPRANKSEPDNNHIPIGVNNHPRQQYIYEGSGDLQWSLGDPETAETPQVMSTEQFTHLESGNSTPTNASSEPSPAVSSNTTATATPPVQDFSSRRRHLCSHCPKGFSSPSNRQRHEKSVHGEITACAHCNKPIKDRADYKKKHAKACKAFPRDEF